MNADTKLKYTRLATLHDVPSVVDLAIKITKNSGYSDITPDRVKLTKVTEQFIVEQPHEKVLLVSVDEADKVVGFIACVPFKLLMSEEQIGIELGWYIEPDASDYKKRHLELRAAYEEWCLRKGMRFAQYAVLNPTPEDVAEVYKNSKSTVLELVYHRRIRE